MGPCRFKGHHFGGVASQGVTSLGGGPVGKGRRGVGFKGGGSWWAVTPPPPKGGLDIQRVLFRESPLGGALYGGKH